MENEQSKGFSKGFLIFLIVYLSISQLWRLSFWVWATALDDFGRGWPIDYYLLFLIAPIVLIALSIFAILRKKWAFVGLSFYSAISALYYIYFSLKATLYINPIFALAWLVITGFIAAKSWQELKNNQFYRKIFRIEVIIFILIITGILLFLAYGRFIRQPALDNLSRQANSPEDCLQFDPYDPGSKNADGTKVDFQSQRDYCFSLLTLKDRDIKGCWSSKYVSIVNVGLSYRYERTCSEYFFAKTKANKESCDFLKKDDYGTKYEYPDCLNAYQKSVN